MSTQFGGASVILPGVRTAVNSGALGTVTSGGVANVALVGSANNGQPKTPTIALNPAQLIALFSSGPLVDAGLAAFGEGAPQLTLSRVDPATQASYIFNDAGSNPSLVLTASSWGSIGNQVQAQLTTGTATGTLDATIQYLPTGYKITSPDLGQAFTLEYAGNGTSAALTISNALSAPVQSAPTASTTSGTIPASTTVYTVVTAVNASGETIASNVENVTTASTTGTNSLALGWAVVAGATKYSVYAGTVSGTEYFAAQVAGGSTDTYTLTAVPTTGALPPAANTTGKNLSTVISGQTDGSVDLDVALNGANGTTYTTVAAVVAFITGQAGYAAGLLGNGTIATQYVDTVASQSILTPTVYTVTAKLGAIVNWVNANAAYVTAAAATGAVNAPATTNLVNLAGGSNGTASATDWQNAIDALAGQDVQIVVPLTATAANVTYLQAWVKSNAQQGLAYQQAFYGLAWGATDTQLTQQAGALNTGDAELVAPGYVAPNSLGVSTNFDGFYMAARVAGLIAGQNSAATPATNKTVHVAQLERTFSTTEQIALLQGGVTCVVPRRKGGFKVLEDVTTNISSTNLYDTQGSIRRAVNVVREHLQDNLDADIGIASAGTATQNALIQRASASLRADVAAGNIAAFSPVTNVTQSPSNPTIWLVDTNVTVEIPVNSILVTVNLSTGAITTAA